MSESQVFEVYECQSYNRTNKWHPHADIPWASKNPPAPCVPLTEITLPNNEWVWASDWVVEKQAGLTDEEGWEYASRISRFLDENRPPKPEAHKWSTVRRRLWTRVMRREIGIRASDIPKAMQKIQAGLASIHSARLRIEEIIKQAPQAAQNEQMISLVQSVKKNINEVLSSLDQISTYQHKHCSPQTTATAAVKKLRNDVLKEEVAIDRAINPGKSSPNINANREFLRLQKAQSNSFAESRSNAVGGGISNRTSSSPPRVGNNKMLQKGGSFASSPYLNTTNLPTMKDLDEANISLSSKGVSNITAGVKSGRADTFDPSVFQSTNHVAGVDSDKGLFVDRNKRELQIAEKFIAVDEATVMQEIIEERDVEIKKMHTGIVQVNEMFVDLARLVKEQEVEIDQIFQNADESHEKTKNALAHIVEADRLQKTGNCVIC